MTFVSLLNFLLPEKASPPNTDFNPNFIRGLVEEILQAFFHYKHFTQST